MSQALQPFSETLRLAKPHRRSVLAGLGATAMATMAGPQRLYAATAPVSHKIGAIEIMMFSDGVLNVPLSFSLPDTPAAESAALFKAHGMAPGGEPMQTNVVLVKTGKEVVLIDAGSGPNFQPTAGKLQEDLEAAGISPEAITKVVFTHAHADHLWGVIDDFGDAPRFPNSSYVMASDEWDFWKNPNTAETVPDWLKGMARGTARILATIENKLERRKAGDSVAPGLSYMATPGHTPGHVSVLVEDGGQRLVIGGDVLANNAVSFARPDWLIGSDFDKQRAVATRKSLLDQLTTDKMPLVGFHLAWPGLGMVERNGGAYRLVSL